jgi:hypothetical protein
MQNQKNGDEFTLPTEPEPIVTDLSQMFVLIYGPPKIGKTTLAATFPRAFFIATESGQRFVSVVRKPCATWIDFKDLVKQLRMPQAKELFKTIVIDTIDLLYMACENHICLTRNIQHPSEEDWGKGWAMVRDEFQNGMRYLTSEGYGVVFIAHHKEIEATIRGVKKSKIVPNLTNQARRVLLPLVDFQFYLSSDNDIPERAVRRIYCKPTLEYESGARQSNMPDAIDDVSYSGIMDAITQARLTEIAMKAGKS